MTHKSSHIVASFAGLLKDLASRLENLSEDQQDKIIAIVEQARSDIAEVADE